MTTTTTHSRAAKGGEFGANGEWYKGGAFINTVPENPKGSPKLRRIGGKQEVEPYKWEVAPAENLMSIFRQLSGIEIFNRPTGTFAFNPDLRGPYATKEAIDRREDLISRFNRGERWI